MTRAAMLLLAALAACARAQAGGGGFYPAPPQQQRAAPRFAYHPGDDDGGLSRNTLAPPLLSGQSAYRGRGPALDSAAAEQQQRPQQPVRRPPLPPGQQQQPQQEQAQPTEEELEEEKPDRLTLLLPQSKFDCTGKTGYYADDGLNCEVFHYCQDNARHSWICPEGFLFHQVHLICMPPSGDNICKDSTQYHFVNDYLYRPINADEAQTRPNVTLRYSDRYYPDSYYEDKEEQQPVLVAQPSPLPQRIPVQTAAPVQQRVVKPVQQFQVVQRPVVQQQVLQQPAPRVQQVLQQPTPRAPQLVSPAQLRGGQPSQVFRSPEEVNIPLQQRRPPPTAAPPQRYQPVIEDDEDYEYDDPPYRG